MKGHEHARAHTPTPLHSQLDLPGLVGLTDRPPLPDRFATRLPNSASALSAPLSSVGSTCLPMLPCRAIGDPPPLRPAPPWRLAKFRSQHVARLTSDERSGPGWEGARVNHDHREAEPGPPVDPNSLTRADILWKYVPMLTYCRMHVCMFS